MNVLIPVYIVEQPAGGARLPTFVVRPLFHGEPVHRAEKLSRALGRLSNDLLQRLGALGQEPRHDELGWWTFHPALEEATVDVRLELASGSHRLRCYFVGFEAMDRRLWFTPALPDQWFEVQPGRTLATRATEVLTRHFRNQEKAGVLADPDAVALVGRARLTTLELSLTPGARAAAPENSKRALLFGGEPQKDGESELRKTGRRLNGLYPDDLERAVGREREVEELARLWSASDRRPVVLVGPRQAGKTAIMHELVWQMGSRRAEAYGGGRDVWLVSPMRLISGMSHLGEWENRVLAILKHAQARDLILYVDDLPGLFTAGVSMASNLTVAQVMRPWLEKRRVRLVGEITPEAWRVLRERDRAFADLFQVIPVGVPDERETLRILVQVCRQLEAAHACEMELEVVPVVYELHARFRADAEFPGKAASFLKRLALRHAGARVTRADVLAEFREQSGLELAMLDGHASLQRAEVVEQLRQRVVGQEAVLEAFADVVCILKARLNDPRRPLATMLLVGPTGVGKTEAAKALAGHLFGSSDRLVRFDMNEFVDGYSASRLTGSWDEPDGLLTAAVRRQPYCVVLLDEIEKAAPEVFDLLLTVLDEGRLTDSLGRVSDFTQAVILMTSNLGARAARSRLGFSGTGQERASEEAVYLSAAEKFFRPEFFNRLDRVVPFAPLSREDLEGIALRLLGGVLTRDGLARRDGFLQVAPEAMARLVELGHHPQLGARALKRVIEREVAQPLAEKLIGLPPAGPMMAQVGLAGANLVLEVRALQPAPCRVFWPGALARERDAAEDRDWRTGILDAVDAVLDRIEAEIERDAPAGGVEWGSLSEAQARYFLCREQLQKVQRIAHAAERRTPRPRQGSGAPALPRPKGLKLVVRQMSDANPRLGRLKDAVSLQLEQMDLEAELLDVPDDPVTALVREMALLEMLAVRGRSTGRVLVVFKARLPADAAMVFRVARSLAEGLGQVPGVQATLLVNEPPETERRGTRIPGALQAICFEGLEASLFFPEPNPVMLTRHGDGSAGLILTTVESVDSLDEARDRLRRWSDAASAGAWDDFGPVTQRMEERRSWQDFRTGVVIPADPSAGEVRVLMLSLLSLPREVEIAVGR